MLNTIRVASSPRAHMYSRRFMVDSCATLETIEFFL